MKTRKTYAHFMIDLDRKKQLQKKAAEITNEIGIETTFTDFINEGLCFIEKKYKIKLKQ